MKLLFLFSLVFLFVACRTDYDIKEVAPADFLESPDADHDHHHDDHDSHADMNADSLGSANVVNDLLQNSHEGHQHAPGTRNHGTQWFFNQPWAASFFWGKLLRDALLFLVIAVVVFILTGRRGAK